ncbi:citrate/2-methylcitrate synthase [Oceanispirochaeta sp.]|jgi:citrate synthase|uniref:citrate/2-methylcitrate synthase n=1 Tax=Oceanispirochaeta sp. TaxID=2035350 RepID=UPI002620D3E5|nr:citrate/2-methylcitrate synthase [Oceanispirochaeta sp.]MDA3957543.1 citrate/2-methylcitrate synthase [Oceanispirochaeta sp.]
MSEEVIHKGLEGVFVTKTSICRVNGEEGRLYYYGYPIEVLEKYSSFEETSYLLLYGHLPNRVELDDFTVKMRKSRKISPPILDMIRSFPRESHPMELLQSSINFLSGYVDHKIEHSAYCNCRQTLHQIAQLPTIIAAFHRIKNGQESIAPRDDLNHGANFLYMLRGVAPDREEGEIMDKCLILHAEHGLNASTFTARVVASSLSTCYCSISAAIGSLYGSLHGGANEKVVSMLKEIDSVNDVRPFLEEASRTRRKIMGMGHRVYKAMDPRAVLMEGYLKTLSAKKGNSVNYNMLKEIQKVFREMMDEKEKAIYPNVDFFSGAVYDLMDIPSSLFTPIFAMARAPGWLSHILEQRQDNRIFRPKALFEGPLDREFIPIENR